MSSAEQPVVRVLFVCLGNICRSPMAEAVFRHLVREAGLSERIEIDSAGTSGWHAGEPPHRGTRAVLDRHGIAHVGQTARQITRADLDHYDFIITMDDANLADVRGMGPARGRVEPLLMFARGIPETEVPDPYYSGGFSGVYDLVMAGCQGLLDQIKSSSLLSR